MLDYKLAKQLKDAGFPQTTPGWCEPSKGQEPVHRPDLGELVKECGNEITSLNHIQEDPFEGKMNLIWEASSVSGDAENPTIKKEKGKTPEEAVARLYLRIKVYEPN